MKIGFDAKRLFNNVTGLGNYSRTLVNQLCNQFPEHQYLLYTPKIKFPDKNTFLTKQEHVNIRTPKTKIPLWRELRSLDVMKRDRLDVYHGLSHELPLGIQKSNIKSVVTIHDLIFKIYPKTYKGVDRKIYDHKFKYACTKSDTITAISQSTKNDIINLYNIPQEKIDVVYQACNPIYLNPQPQEFITHIKSAYQLPNDYLLYVGSIIERKGLLKIIKALELIKDESRPPLVIIGKGNTYKEVVKKYTKEKNLEKYLIWASVQDDLELQAIYQGAQLFIYPSIYEGFGIPVVEALLSKTPVITSNVSSLPEAAGPDSICIDPNNIEELAFAITRILGDSLLQENMIKAGRKYAEDTFNTELVTAQMMEIYKRLG